MSGQHAVAGAAVILYAAGSAGYGTSAGELSRATSDGAGNWTLGFNCPAAGSQLYAVARGGDAGSGANSVSAMSATVGACGAVASAPLVIDEMTTLASVYALAAFLDGSGAALGSSAGNALGLSNAIAGAGLLVDPGSGQARTNLPGGAEGALPSATLNTLANAMAACTASNGATSGACGSLFAIATPTGGNAPGDTLQAMLNIARNPSANVAALFALASSSPQLYQPALDAAPGDWTLAIQLSGSGLNNPTAVAIDAQGNAWIANYHGSAVSKFSPAGAPLSGSAGFVGGGLQESFSIAVDQGGNAWVTNEESAGGVNQKLGSVTRLAPDGTFLSGAAGYVAGGIAFPQAIAIDQGGNAWIANYGDGALPSSLTKLGPDGGALSPAAGFTGAGLAFPAALAVAADGSVWVSNQGGDSVSALSSAGAAVSPATGYVSGAVAAPYGVCIDAGGNIWVVDSGHNAVVELAGPAGPSPGSPLSPTGGYTGGGLRAPSGCAIDGAGNIWISNYQGASVTELAGNAGSRPGLPLSGSKGYQSGALSLPAGMAVDASGNLWIANSAEARVTVLLGVASPVDTPLSGPPRLP